MGKDSGEAGRCVPEPCHAICLDIQRATLEPLSEPAVVKSDVFPGKCLSS